MGSHDFKPKNFWSAGKISLLSETKAMVWVRHHSVFWCLVAGRELKRVSTCVSARTHTPERQWWGAGGEADQCCTKWRVWSWGRLYVQCVRVRVCVQEKAKLRKSNWKLSLHWRLFLTPEEQALAEGSASSAAGRAMVAYSMTCDLSKCLCSWNVVSTRMEVPAKGHSSVWERQRGPPHPDAVTSRDRGAEMLKQKTHTGTCVPMAMSSKRPSSHLIDTFHIPISRCYTSKWPFHQGLLGSVQNSQGSIWHTSSWVLTLQDKQVPVTRTKLAFLITFNFIWWYTFKESLKKKVPGLPNWSFKH